MRRWIIVFARALAAWLSAGLIVSTAFAILGLIGVFVLILASGARGDIVLGFVAIFYFNFWPTLKYVYVCMLPTLPICATALALRYEADTDGARHWAPVALLLCATLVSTYLSSLHVLDYRLDSSISSSDHGLTITGFIAALCTQAAVYWLASGILGRAHL